MTTFVYRIALIVPHAQRAAANRIALAMGWGAGCFSVPLARDSTGTATHWGLSAVTTQSFVDMLSSTQVGAEPEHLDPADVAAVMPVLLSAIGPAATPAGAQFDALAEGAGLVRIFPE